MNLNERIQQAASGGGGGGGYSGGGSYSGGGNMSAFNYLRDQITARNQALLGQSGPDYFAGTQQSPNAWQNYLSDYNQQNGITRNGQEDRGMFSMSGGTKGMYNDKYRKANLLDTLAIKAGEAGEWWMNAPSNLASMAGNEQLAQDLKFDASKFDLSNGLDMGDVQQIGNFALSLPGMIPGGLLEGVSKGYEGITGKPVRENRQLKDGSYEYADYNMDFSQRAADIIDAGIDVAGTFLGASGKAVSVVGKGFGRAAGKNAMKSFEEMAAGDIAKAGKYSAEAEKQLKKAQRINEFTANMGKGIFERTNLLGQGKAAQLAYNVGEEAGEEYVQSYMEDIRNKELNDKSFDKAVQSAAWGAVGGGMMHAGAAGLNRLVHGRFDDEHRADSMTEDPADALQASQSQRSVFEKYDDRNNVYEGRTTTSAIERRAKDIQKNPEDVPASGSAYGVTRDDDLDITKIRLTLGMLDGVVQTNDKGKSIAGLADAFHTTTDEINRISSIRDNTERHAAWVALLERAKAKGPVRIIAGRNPDTNGVGVAYMDIASIERGYGVHMNANAWKMLGGDTDGDRYQVYLHPEGGVRANGYLTDVFSDSVGNSRLADDYTKWLVDDNTSDDGKKRIQEIRDSVSTFLKDANDAVKAKYGVSSFLTDEERKSIVDGYYKAAMHGNTDLNMMTSWLQVSKGKIAAALNRIEKSDKQDASRIVGEMMQSMHVTATATASTFDEVIQSKNLEVEKALGKVVEDWTYLNPGDNKGKTRVAEFLAEFGRKIGTNIGLPLGNPIMRQTASMRFDSMRDLNVFFNASTMEETDVEDRLENLIAFSFQLEGVGADVENTIEGVFWASVFDMSLTRFMSGKDGHVDVAANWDEFSSILAEEYKANAKRFNDVLDRNSTSWGTSVKLGTMKQLDLADSPIGLAQVFRKTFGHVTIDSLMSLPTGHPLSGLTINQIAGEYGLGNAGSFGPFGATPQFNKFFKYVIKDIGSNFRATEARYRSSIQEQAEMLLEYGMTNPDDLIRLKYDKKGKAVGHEWITEDFNALRFAIESAHYTFGEDVCSALGIHTMEGFLTSHWGREWMSGDVDRMMNAVFSAKATYLYNNVINLATKRDAGWENEVEDELVRLQSQGGLFESAIYRFYEKNNGDLEFLRQLTSLDISYDQKSRLWEQMTQKDDTVGGLFSEMIATPNSELGTSAFTKNLKDAKRSIAEVRKRSNAHNIQVLKQINDSSLSNDTKVRAVKHFFGRGYTSMSTHAIAAFVDSQSRVVKEMMDKGVAPNTTDIVYQMSEKFKDGQLFSYLEGLDYNFGNMMIGSLQTNRVQLCKILSDPEASIRVYDRRKNGYLDVNREAIFREVLGDKYSSYDIDNQWEPWNELFKRCPALVSIVTPTHIGTRTKDGVTSTVEGTKGSLYDSMLKYKENAIDFEGQYEREQRENEVLGIAMRDPNWWAAFVADPDFAKSDSLARTHDVTKELLKKHVNWLMKWASLEPDGEGYVNRCRLIGDRARRKAWAHVDKLRSDARLMDYLRTTAGTVDSSLYSGVSSSMMQYVVDVSVNKLLFDRNLFIMNDDVIDLESQQGQQDMMMSMFSEVFGIDVSSMMKSVPNINDAMDEFQKYVQGQMNMMFIMDNMVDDNLFHYEQMYNQYGRVGQIREMLRKHIDNTEASKKAAVEKKLEPVFDALDQWESGSFSGFSKLVFGKDVMQDAADNFAPLVITNGAVDNMTQEQFTEAVMKICREYNFNESEKKIKKAIKDAFDEKNPNGREERVNLKNYFNQIILNYELNRMTPGGTTQNHLAPKQTIEAYRAMIKVGDKVRDEMIRQNKKIQANTDELPELRFDFENPVTSVMSSHMAMNAASGAITTGIGLDGGMLSCLAGFGLIDTYECGALPTIVEANTLDPETMVGLSYRYSAPVTNDAGEMVKNPDGTVKMNTVEGHFTNRKDVERVNAMGVQVEVWTPGGCMCGGCARCAPISPSRSERGGRGKNKYSPIGRKISHLINWMQEPRHLRAKKTLAALKAFSDPREINSSLQKSYTASEVAGGNARQMILSALNLRREALQKTLNAAFRDPEASELHFDDGNENESTLFAGLMTNFVEVSIEGQGSFIVSSSALVSDDVFMGRGYGFVDENGMLLPGDVTFKPVVMSLQEVAESITRRVVENYYLARDNGEDVTSDKIRKWANDAMGNWDEYNSNPITMAEFLDGIVPNPDIIDNPVLGDSNPTARMLWNDDVTHYLSRTMEPESTSQTTYMDEKSWMRVQNFNDQLRQRANVNLENMRIVAAHGDPRRPGEYESWLGDDPSKVFDKKMLEMLPKPENTGSSTTMYDNNRGRSYNLVEIYIGRNVSDATDAYHAAASKGREILVPTKIAEQMRGIYKSSNSHKVTISGQQFMVLDPSVQNYLNKFQKDRIVLATVEMDPDDITIAMGSDVKLGNADAATYAHPDLEVHKRFVQEVDIVPTKILDYWTTPVRLADNSVDFSSITMDNVDFHYYDNNIRNRNVGSEDRTWGPDNDYEAQSYRAAVQHYLELAKQEGFDPSHLTNVKQGDCVGLVMQVGVNGKKTFAPIFYEGTVAHTADIVTIEEDRFGHVKYTASSRNVDYNGNEDVKLDLFGVAYKTMTHKAPESILKKWAAIADGGFKLTNRPDFMFDDMSIGSRLIEMGDRLLHQNVYFFTRKCGINAFYKRGEDGRWTLRGDLGPDMTYERLVDLASGAHGAWANVADGTWKVYADAKMNQLFMRCCQDIMGLGGYCHLFFNSARVMPTLDPATNALGTEGSFKGRERRRFDPCAVFKNWNTDDFLRLWNGLDSRLVPASLHEKDDFSKTFDTRGRMVDMNTEDGSPRRMTTVIGLNFYTSGQGNAVSDLSRGAAYSDQHVLQDLLRSGVYSKYLKDTIEALSVGVGNIDSVVRKATIDEELKHFRKHRGERAQLNQSTYERAKEMVEDPLVSSLIESRRQNFMDIIADMDDPLPIVNSLKDNTSALADPVKKKEIETLLKSFNEALSNGRAQPADVNLRLEEVMVLVRLVTGTTTHTNLGVTTITYDQFKQAVERMIQNRRDGYDLIMGGRYGHRGSDDRVSIPLMPKGLAVRLSQTNYYKDQYHGDVNKMLDDQYEQLKTATLDAIKLIKDKPKQRALYQFADAMCYANGKETISGNILGDIYMHDLISAARDFSFALTDYDPEIFKKYDETCRLTGEWVEKVRSSELQRDMTRVDLGNGKYDMLATGEPRNIMVYTMRQLAAARKAIGLTYIEMPLSNCLDRAVGQTGTSIALGLGRRGIGPYTVKQRMNEDLRQATPKRDDMRAFWSALREAQLYGVDRQLLNEVYNGVDLQQAIRDCIKDQGVIERLNNKVMNIASGKDWGIEKQIQNFLDRFWQRSETEAPWWHMPSPGDPSVTVFEMRMQTDPIGLVIDLMSGSGEGRQADVLLARQCMQFALASDNAQKNLVSALHAEYAKRSALYDFGMTTFVSPYFQYATNRLGRVLQAVAPISSIHYMATEFFSKGPGADLKIKPGSDTTFGDLGLEEFQNKASLKEALVCDMMHMGGTLVAMTIAGLALSMPGMLEPPDDPDKRGNFEEWTFMGMRINANWWIEDSLGIALPLATFMTSAMRGEPRIDLITNGLAHYLGSNPLVKAGDAIQVLFDPMAELYQDYENDVEGYAKAMGGPPDIYRVAKGKATSFGLSYVSQFVTPGFLKEIYQAGQGNEVAYKRIFETDQTGRLTLDARENNATEYTTYEDAVLRKFTKDNPVMGFLADVLFRPETGYMNHEMPDRVIYDPEMMNSVAAFSMYEDPYTKQVEKSPEEKLVTAQMLIATLQGNSVEELVSQGFMIDYDTKQVVGQVIWDMIAAENDQWAQLEQNGALSYYNAGYGTYDDNVAVISEMRQAHYNYINMLKDLYNNKLWADELKVVPTYNQSNTAWAQDVNGNWYATGFEPVTILSPIKIAPGESSEFPQSTMSRENDWQTQSGYTGNPLGQRALIEVDPNRYAQSLTTKPNIKSYSEDGTDTGHSSLYNEVLAAAGDKNGNGDNDGTGNESNKNGTKYPKGGGYGGGGGGGGRRGGGGGGGGRRYGSGVPSAYAPSVNTPTSAYVPKADTPRSSLSKIMNTDNFVRPNEQYLRPDFETKGSREAYKRSDI